MTLAQELSSFSLQRRQEEGRIEFDLVLSHKRKSSNVEMITKSCQVYVFPIRAGNYGVCAMYVEFSYTQSYIHALLTFFLLNIFY